MITIGITGGSGSGKTTALAAARRIGAAGLDCDKVYHELLESDAGLKRELETRWKGVLKDGVIDRAFLANAVFGDASQLSELETITHKYISREIERRITESKSIGKDIMAIEAIRLIESGRAKQCDLVFGVTAPREIRINRIMARDKIPREAAIMRINAQKPDSYFKENCDFVLEGAYHSPEEFIEYAVTVFDKTVRPLLKEENDHAGKRHAAV